MHGLPQDRDSALELWHRAAELGHAGAYNNIGCAYYMGMVWKEMKRRLRITTS